MWLDLIRQFKMFNPLVDYSLINGYFLQQANILKEFNNYTGKHLFREKIVFLGFFKGFLWLLQKSHFLCSLRNFNYLCIFSKFTIASKTQWKQQPCQVSGGEEGRQAQRSLHQGTTSPQNQILQGEKKQMESQTPN